ncbi:ABC transporter substrate-binding protein [Permianibacter aggregans]|uniref:Iron complex transport system substrate-binding protein n=1 Tax=Permianibacter aggregans TaxID=1510150 RepID=A0A4V3D8D5_9GAMM|nr:ABC transporter substrate-binding protein [Permianibacter aggregans]QGX41554.1 ABC transporter substrate-binding protein [Permianibacter aggregans]TDQ51357.1 iron complex transport system substrate-binding protein [Permianibacter aggregans]
MRFSFLALFLTAASVAQAAPQRVVSLSLCMDEYLLALAEPEQIAGVSFLARDRQYSYHWRQAQQVNVHHGRVEEIIALNPDLILASRHETGATQRLLQRLDYPVAVFDSPQRFAEIEKLVLQLGQRLQRQARAQQLLMAMREQLDMPTPATQKKLLAVNYAPNSYVPGQQSIKHEVMQRAGLLPIAEPLQWQFDGELPLEALLQHQPDVLILETTDQRQDALAHRQLQHPALREYRRHTINIEIPTSLWLCAQPATAKAVVLLNEAIR